MPSFEEIQKARIANSFNTNEGLSELTKAEIIDIEKGGKRALIGEKRTFAGREYIKTADGWKFHGKGTGSKAQSHVAGALEHHIGEKKESDTNSIAEIGSTVKIVNHRDLPTSLFGLGGQNLKVVDYERGTLSVPKFLVVEDKNGERHSVNPNYTEKSSSKTTHKDATDQSLKKEAIKAIDLVGKMLAKDTMNDSLGDLRMKAKELGRNAGMSNLAIDEAIREARSKYEKRGFKEESGDEDVTGKGEGSIKDYIASVTLTWKPTSKTDKGTLTTKIKSEGKTVKEAEQAIIDYYKRYNPNVVAKVSNLKEKEE